MLKYSYEKYENLYVRKDAHMLGKRLDYQVEENKIHFFFEKEEAFLEVITESIMNVFVPYETKGHRPRQSKGRRRSGQILR